MDGGTGSMTFQTAKDPRRSGQRGYFGAVPQELARASCIVGGFACLTFHRTPGLRGWAEREGFWIGDTFAVKWLSLAVGQRLGMLRHAQF
jgi:hypothetical protein